MAAIEECSTCKFFREGECRIRAPLAMEPKEYGYALNANKFEVIKRMAIWPTVTPDHWCGEWVKK